MSLTINSPTSALPEHNDKIAPGILFFSKTDVIIFVVATEVREVVGAPFQITALPQTYSYKQWDFKFIYLNNYLEM